MDRSRTWEEAVESLLNVAALVRSIQVTGCSGDEFQSVVDAGRVTQQALDGLMTRLGLAAASSNHGGSRLPPYELLRGRTRSVRSSTARRDASRAEVAGSLTEFTTAAVEGTIGGDQLDSLARVAKGLTDSQRQELNTPELARAAVDLSADEFDVRVRAAAERAKADYGLGDAVAARKASEFKHWFDPRAQMGKFSGCLDPERYEIVHTAIDRAVSTLARQADEPTAKNSNLAAEALVTLISGQQDGSDRQSGRRTPKPLITVVVDHDTLRFGPHEGSIRETVNGHSVPPETMQRHLCDAQIRAVSLDRGGLPVNVGRKYRTATDHQWAAIQAIYPGCAWDGCDRPLTWCQLHHIHEWEHGGPTDLCNLVPLCSHHHHQVHEGRWTVRLEPDRRLRTFRPDGVEMSVVGPPSRHRPTASGPDP